MHQDLHHFGLTGVHIWGNFNYIVHKTYQKSSIDESELSDQVTWFGILACCLDGAQGRVSKT